MRMLLIGGNGTIGKAIHREFSKSHEVIVAGRTRGDILADISDPASVVAMYEKLGMLDAVVCAAGETRWAPMIDMSEDDYYIGINRKLMGQVNLVRLGIPYLTDGGSFTLTTGILGDDPVKHTTGAAVANGALHSFTKAAAIELPRSQRINTVSPGLVADAAERLGHLFPGYYVVSMEDVVKGYSRAVFGPNTGEVIRIYR